MCIFIMGFFIAKSGYLKVYAASFERERFQTPRFKFCDDMRGVHAHGWVNRLPLFVDCSEK